MPNFLSRDDYANDVLRKRKQSSINSPYTEGARVLTGDKTYTSVSNKQIDDYIAQRNNTQTQTTTPTLSNPLNITQSVTTQTPTQQVTTSNAGQVKADTSVIPNTTKAYVPEPVKIDTSFISFGDQARQRNAQDTTYLDTRNNMLAQGFASQNVVNEQDILKRLQTMSNFSAQPIEDQQNTAKSIASMIQQMQTGTQQTGQQTTSGQQQYTSQEMIDRATENTIQNEQQNFLQDVYRSGTIYDRNKEDLENQNRIIQQNLDRKAEDTRIGIERQIDDIVLQTQRAVAGYDMVGALKGFNRGSGFIAGLTNIKDDANRTINRLQQDLSRYMDATGEAKDEALKQLNQGMTRAKEDFEYAMRDVMQLAQIDMNSVVAKYGLSSEKMQQKLDTITLDVLQKRENLLSTYIANTKNTIGIVNDQLDLIKSQDEFIGQQRDRFTSILDANDGAALASMTPTMVQEYVNKGYLAPEQGAAYFELMKGKSIATLQANGTPTNEDITQVTSLIEGGMTPAEAVAKVMQDNPDRYEAGAEWQPLPGGGGILWRVGKDGKPEFISGPGVTSSPGTPGVPTQGPTPGVQYNPADSTTLQSAMEGFISQYPDGSKGTRDGYCGQFVNDYLKSAGVTTTNLFLDPITKKKELANSQTPTIGSIAIMDSPTDPQYGHVGIVTQVNQDGSFVMKESNYVAPGKVSTRTIPAGGATYGFFDPTINQTQQESGPVGALGIPISYERRIKNMVPATLMNSEIELQQLNDTIKSMYNKGMSAEDAVLTYLGVDINPEYKEFGGKIIESARGLRDIPQNFFSTVSDYINKGQKSNAVNYLEREAIKQAQGDNPDLKFSDAGTVFAVKQAKNIQDMITKYEGQFGPITGKWNDYTKGFLGNKEAQQLATTITQAISKMRNDLVGSNITEGEKQAIDALIPKLDETAATAKIKVKNMIDTPLLQYNQARSYAGLPELDVNTLLNRESRVKLYEGSTGQTTTQGSTYSDYNEIMGLLGRR